MCVTMAGLIPSNLNLSMKPTKLRFLFSLASSALSFFFFSFQVHEKSILLCVIPVSLLISVDEIFAFSSTWIHLVAIFSMFPLLSKDQVVLGYAVAFIFLFIVAWAFARSLSQKTALLVLTTFFSDEISMSNFLFQNLDFNRWNDHDSSLLYLHRTSIDFALSLAVWDHLLRFSPLLCVLAISELLSMVLFIR